MSRTIHTPGEKKITDLLFARYADAEKASASAPTMKDEREAAAADAAGFQKRDAAAKTRFASLTEKAAQAARKVEAGDSESIEKMGAQALQAKLEGWLGKGGFDIQREEFRQKTAHKDATNDRYSVTDTALMSYAAHILLPSGGMKTAKCVVAYDASKAREDQFEVQPMFFDALDQKRPMTEAGVKAFMAGEPATKATDSKEPGVIEPDNTPLVFFNSDEQVVGYEKLEVPPKLAAVALKKIADAGFEIEDEYLGRETGVGSMAHVIMAAPDRHEELRTITAAIVDQWDDKSWFERSMGDDKKFHQANDEGWPERTKEKTVDGMPAAPKNPHEWPERAMEKPGEEATANSAYKGLGMLKYERRKEMQAKVPAKEKEAQKGVRQAKRVVEASKKTVENAADRMARLAKKFSDASQE